MISQDISDVIILMKKCNAWNYIINNIEWFEDQCLLSCQTFFVSNFSIEAKKLFQMDCYVTQPIVFKKCNPTFVICFQSFYYKYYFTCLYSYTFREVMLVVFVRDLYTMIHTWFRYDCFWWFVYNLDCI